VRAKVQAAEQVALGPVGDWSPVVLVQGEARGWEAVQWWRVRGAVIVKRVESSERVAPPAFLPVERSDAVEGPRRVLGTVKPGRWSRTWMVGSETEGS